MNIVYLCSRDWSYEILRLVSLHGRSMLKIPLVVEHKALKYSCADFGVADRVLSIDTYKALAQVTESIRELAPDVILSFGWSGYIPKTLRDICPCLVLHPSRLPKFRGGSPIQHQLLEGVNTGAVTILRAVDEIDAGPILFQAELDLTGSLRDIKGRIANLGFAGLISIALESQRFGQFAGRAQDASVATFYKRRAPSESEIFPDDFRKRHAKYFADLVRGLQDEYPRAFVRCAEDSLLYLEATSYANQEATNGPSR